MYGYELRADEGGSNIWLLSTEWRPNRVQFEGFGPFPMVGYFYGYDPDVIPHRVAEAFAMAYSRHLQKLSVSERDMPSLRAPSSVH